MSDPAEVAALRSEVAAMVRQCQVHNRRIGEIQSSVRGMSLYLPLATGTALQEFQFLLGAAADDISDLKSRLTSLKKQLNELERQR